MDFIQLNRGWNAEPNAPELIFQLIGKNISLSFYLNFQKYKHFAQGDTGILTFCNCRQYRLGQPSEEGFYLYGLDRYEQYGIQWGEFYLIKDSDWQVNFPNPQIICETQIASKMNHYLFYFKDKTFECIAESYNFSIKAS